MQRKLPTSAKILIYGILLIICLTCIIPIATVVSISLSTNLTILKEGYGILPKDFTLDAYKYVFRDVTSILRSYGVSILVTVLGCVGGLLLDALMAYALSRNDYRYKSVLTVYILIPILISGGMVPTYILLSRYLHMKDTFAVLILPLMITPWFIVLLRTFFSQIPMSLIEAATMDGANEWLIFIKVILPLAKPALATIGMFITLNYWNDWFQPLMYIEDRSMYNLQFRLYLIMKDAEEMIRNSANMSTGVSLVGLPTETMRMAMCVIAAGPMLMVFPFFQKYFVKGLTVGAVKG